MNRVLGNRYEIIEKIGGGGMALVYKAKCSLLNRFVAVKVLRSEFVNDEEFIEKFKREAQAAASLSHPNIVSIYDVGVEEDTHYIVMEYIDGETLKDIIKKKGKLSTEETVDIGLKVSDAINHAHNNKVIHRDIKPHNIMVRKDGRVKVTDFGIARAATSTTITSTGSIIGSAHYFSPEQARGGYTDEKSDIYSLGIMMYEMCTGKLPFQGDSPVTIAIKHIQEEPIPPTEVDPSVSPSLENIIMKCIEKNQSLRYSNTSELIEDLKRVKYGDENLNMGTSPNLNDSPTQVMSTLDSTVIMSNDASDMINSEIKAENDMKKNKKNKNKKNKGKSSKLVTISAILLALVVVMLGTGAVIALRGISSNADIPVPDLSGMTKLEAEEEVRKVGLKLEVVGEKESEEEPGLVIEQINKAGDKVKKGYPIKVILSKEMDIKLIVVPNIKNYTVSQAREILNEKGLTISRVIYEDSELPKDTIIDHTPRAGDKVEEGTEIDVTVSRGKKVTTSRVPNLAGLTEDVAERMLESNGLRLGNVNKEESQQDKGTVISQSISSGNEVPQGTKIDIIISDGPKKTNQNNNNHNNGNNNSNNGSNSNNNNNHNNGNNSNNNNGDQKEPDDNNSSNTGGETDSTSEQNPND